MAETPETVVKSLLHDSEEVKIALEAQLYRSVDLDINNDDDSDEDSIPTSPRTDTSARQTRIIAIIVHLDTTSGGEQACLFCLKPNTLLSAYLVEHAFPIIDGFSISMAQARRKTIDLTANPTASVLNEQKSELTLTINSGYDHESEPLVLLTHDIHRLRSLLAECKRLRDSSIANTEPGAKLPYTWMLPYASRPNPALVSFIPPDLRHAQRPVHDSLASNYAGSSTPANDVFDISVLREDWMRSQIQKKYDSVASDGNKAILRIRAGTFNVNGKLPSQDLAGWVQGREKQFIPPLEDVSPFNVEDPTANPLESAGRDAQSVQSTVVSSSESTLVADAPQDDSPDLIVLGFQELDLSAGALLYSTEATRENAWLAAVMAGLGEKAALYEKLVSKQLVGMLLVIIVKRDAKRSFSQIQASSVGAGIMGLMGNKGGTAVRLVFTPNSTADAGAPRPVVLTFVNAHLAAFDEMYEKRNTDFHDLSKRLLFDSGAPSDIHINQAVAATVPLNVYQADALFWLGDLNYRINLPDRDIRALLERAEDRSSSLPELLKFDQLKTALRTRKAFTGFNEFPITHLPSYRFSPGIASDSLGYDMKRKPAWTDRILNMCSHTAHVNQVNYRSHAEITMSDHKPVSADFEVHIPAIDSAELDAWVHDVWKDVANIEHADVNPQLTVEPTGIEFDKIGYQRPDSKIITLKNAGKIASPFRFISLAPGDNTHPRWLHVEPLAGLVLPGEHVDIVLSVDIQKSEAAVLNLEDAQLEALLILHTSLGKDHFITVNGLWERTCFATNLQRLVRMTDPVRSMVKPELVPEDQAATAPKELMRLVGWLMSNAADMDELFLTPGEPSIIADVREALDTGTELPSPSTNDRAALCLSVAQCLLQFVDSLPEPLAPTALHSRCASVPGRDEAFELLNEFPNASVNVWIAITSFLHFICQQEAGQNDSHRAEKLAAVFAPVMFRLDGLQSAAVGLIGLRKFVKAFII
ncbi:DNase I-like protein [Trametopsis cervina]|nr:DNase I-like protein [Trametopsis cervina]